MSTLTDQIAGVSDPAFPLVVNSKLDATADPTVDDDTADGYSVGSLWVRPATASAWVCTDKTLGAAVWTPLVGLASATQAVVDAAVATAVATYISNTAYASSWNGVTTIAPTKNVVYDEIELRAPKADPTFTGSFTSPGIDDNATEERVQIADTLTSFGSATEASEYWLVRPIADGLLGLGGDDAVDQGANIRLYGAGHASKAFDFDFRQGTSVIAQWDSSASFWTFTNDVGVNGGSFYIAELAAARTDYSSYGQFWVLNLSPNLPAWTDDAGNDAVILTEQFIILTADYTLTSQTAAQAMFNSPAAGALTVRANTTYFFECVFELSAMSATSGSFGFAFLGTATITRQKWMSVAADTATITTAVATQSTFNAAANVALCTASTATAGYARIFGTLRIGVGGTLIPAVSQTTAATAVVEQDSYFRIWPAGVDTAASFGNWA